METASLQMSCSMLPPLPRLRERRNVWAELLSITYLKNRSGNMSHLWKLPELTPETWAIMPEQWYGSRSLMTTMWRASHGSELTQTLMGCARISAFVNFRHEWGCQSS